MFPSACSFVVLASTVFHDMFRSAWPSSGVEVMFQSACSFIVLASTVFHYMFRSTWPSSGVEVMFQSACSFVVLASTVFHCMFRATWPRMLEAFCFAAFLRGHTRHVFHLCLVPVLFSFVICVASLRVCLSACKEMTKITKESR
jgi:hypothetical protein